MILFVFEGARREPNLFRTVEYLFFPKNCQSIICSYGNNIYNLYKQMTQTDFNEDIVAILMEKYRGMEDSPLASVKKRSDISEVYLFFDYDIQNQNQENSLALSELNAQLQKMMGYFTDETECGKLYINYPMIESIRYTKELPDADYCSYTIPIEQCGRFKEIADDFSFYKNLDFISFRWAKGSGTLKIPSERQVEQVRENWKHLVRQNSEKACRIIGRNQGGVGASQQMLFEAQLSGFVNKNNSIAVLNSMPLFLKDYFGGVRFQFYKELEQTGRQP